MRGISTDAENRSQCGSSEGTFTWRQKNHCPWGCQHVNFGWVSWEYFEKQSLNMWFTTIFVPHLLCVNSGKKKKSVTSFPPYLPDLVPCDFYFLRTQDYINGEEILWYYHNLRNPMEHSKREAYTDDISNIHWLWLHLSSQVIYFVLFQFAPFPNIVLALHDKVNFLHSISIRSISF